MMIFNKSAVGSAIMAVVAVSFTACAVPRAVDNVTLARAAKEAIGVGSIDEITVSNVQKMPMAEGALPSGRSYYRYNVDTVRGKKFICDANLAGVGANGKQVGGDVVKCGER